MVMALLPLEAGHGAGPARGRLQKEPRKEELRRLALPLDDRWQENSFRPRCTHQTTRPLPPSCRGTTSTTTEVTLVYQSYCKRTQWSGPPEDWQGLIYLLSVVIWTRCLEGPLTFSRGPELFSGKD